jgi:hypothetical protein
MHRERVVVQTVTQQSPSAVVVVKEIEQNTEQREPFATRDDPVEKSQESNSLPNVRSKGFLRALNAQKRL